MAAASVFPEQFLPDLCDAGLLPTSGTPNLGASGRPRPSLPQTESPAERLSRGQELVQARSDYALALRLPNALRVAVLPQPEFFSAGYTTNSNAVRAEVDRNLAAFFQNPVPILSTADYRAVVFRRGAPIALYFADEKQSGQLVPVAIQLGQTPNQSLLVTPLDGSDWTLAKLGVRAATLESSLALAELGVDELFDDFKGHAFPRDIARRRGLDIGPLSDFPYRDDGTLVWRAVHRYVGEYIRVYYRTDEDVVADFELQTWYRTLRAPIDSGRMGVTSLSSVLDDRRQLIELLAQIIFCAGPQHSAIAAISSGQPQRLYKGCRDGAGTRLPSHGARPAVLAGWPIESRQLLRFGQVSFGWSCISSIPDPICGSSPSPARIAPSNFCGEARFQRRDGLEHLFRPVRGRPEPICLSIEPPHGSDHQSSGHRHSDQQRPG